MTQINPNQTVTKINDETLEIETTNKNFLKKEELKRYIAEHEEQLAQFKAMLKEFDNGK